jgi:hypothetical protein
MTLLLFTAALISLSQPGLAALERPMTAGELYGDCVRYAARAVGTANSGDEREFVCEVKSVAVEVRIAAEAAMVEAGDDRSTTRTLCPPESTSEEEKEAANRPAGEPAARAFIAYVDAHPAARSEDADAVFERALTEAWPCPR